MQMSAVTNVVDPTKPAWVRDWVGLPFAPRGRTADGVDCWGLVRLIYARSFGIALPAYDEEYSAPSCVMEVAALVAGVRRGWREILAGQERDGDVVLMRVRGLPCHVGVVAGGGWMVHAEEGIGSVLEAYGGPRWGRRVLGFFRHDCDVR